MKCIFYFGHRSRYGQSFLEPLLESKFFDIQEIVVGDLPRWNIFGSALSGDKISASRLKEMSKENAEYLKSLRALVSKRKPGISVREIHDANAPSEIEYLKNAGFDLAISVAFPQIFKKSFILAFQKPPVNFHPSYLPRCRGAHPVYWTIAGKEENGGTSCHFLTEHLDQGPIVAQIKIPITSQTYYKGLYDAIVNESSKLVQQVEEFFRSGRQAVEQSSDISYFRNDRKLHRKIYWQTETWDTIHAKIRAGKSFSFARGRMMVFNKVEQVDGANLMTNNLERYIEPGTIVSVTGRNEMILYATGALLKVTFSFQYPRLIDKVFFKIWGPIKLNVGEKLA